MNDYRGAIRIKKWLAACLQRHTGHHRVPLCDAVHVNTYVGRVARVRSFRVPYAVLLVVRVEVGAGRREGRLALADGVNMKPVYTSRQSGESAEHQKPVRSLFERDFSNAAASRVKELRARSGRNQGDSLLRAYWLWRTSRCCSSGSNQRQYYEGKFAHRVLEDVFRQTITQCQYSTS